jgi:hypothetical protein
MEPYFAWMKFFLCDEVVAPKSKLICRYRICWLLHGLYWVIGLPLCYLTTIIMFTIPSIEIVKSNDINVEIKILGILSVGVFCSIGWLFHMPLCILDGYPYNVRYCCDCDSDACCYNPTTAERPVSACDRFLGIYLLYVYIFFIIFSNMYSFIFLTYVTQDIIFIMCLPYLLGLPTAYFVIGVLSLCYSCPPCIKNRVVEFETNRIRSAREQIDEPINIHIPEQEVEHDFR